MTAGEQKTRAAAVCAVTSAALCALLATAPVAQTTEAATEPFRATVASVPGADIVVLADGRRVRLQGLSLVAEAVRPAHQEARLRAFLAEAAVGRELWVHPEERGVPGDPADLLATLHPRRDGPSINEQALAGGLAVLSCRSDEVAALAALRAAAVRAQRERRGWFDRPHTPLDPIPYLNGAVLGLHSADPRWDYGGQLEAIAGLGFRHVCLLLSAFVPDVTATVVRRDSPRTVDDGRLVKTIEQAHRLGMTVLLLPIVLLEKAGEDDWRGSLAPRDEGAFWRSYDRFLAHYLDVAEATSVELFSIGSELSSLEHRTDAWRRLIANARGRYRGALTYSANWDHVQVPRFFGQLDVVGMTAYFSLTEKTNPTPEELRAAWARTATDLQRAVGAIGKPVVFTELGYASQDGINTDPWNYCMNPERVDLEEQAQCFAAFLATAPSMLFLRGAYLYDFFDRGGPTDGGYSPRGKPALEQWRRWARYTPQ